MFFRALIIAFAMYTKIPMPSIKWDSKSTSIAMCFFPLVGGVIWLAMQAVFTLLEYIAVGNLFKACIMTVIPVLITGGIHMDGFLDTLDVINSYTDKRKRLEILKDPHCGAFAVIGSLVYFTLSIGLWSEATNEALPAVGLGYVLSRTLSAISILSFPKAKKNGLAVTFSSGGSSSMRFVLVLFLVLELCAGLCFGLKCVLSLLIAAAVSFAYHYYNCKKHFGGITGDLAGFFLQLCELLTLAAAVIIYRWCIL